MKWFILISVFAALMAFGCGKSKAEVTPAVEDTDYPGVADDKDQDDPGPENRASPPKEEENEEDDDLEEDEAEPEAVE